MRKHGTYRPRALLNPLTCMRPAPEEKRTRAMLGFHTALEAMVAGKHPGEEEWRSLSDAINTLETLTLHFGKLAHHEVMPVINAAIEGMVHAARRYRAGQGMRLDAAGLAALRDVLDIYDQCLKGLTEREMILAQQETQRRVFAVQRSRRVPENVVMV